VNETRDQYRDILYTAYHVAAGREMVRQHKEGRAIDKEQTTDAGILAVATQVLRDVMTFMDGEGISYIVKEEIEQFADERGIDLNESE
jgi:hypothetical protein